MYYQIYKIRTKAIMFCALFFFITIQNIAQENDGAVVGAQVINENALIKEFKRYFNEELKTIYNAEYLSYSQQNEEDNYIFYVTSQIEFKNGNYTLRITLKEDGKETRTFSFPTKSLKSDDNESNEAILTWVNQVVKNINYYNGDGNGEFLYEILIYKPQVEIPENSNTDTFDKVNTKLIQNRIYELLNENTELRNRCILLRTDNVYSDSNKHNNSQANIYCTYIKEDANPSPINLYLFLGYQENEICFHRDFDFGTHKEMKLDELEKYIESNWVKNFLIERNCN